MLWQTTASKINGASRKKKMKKENEINWICLISYFQFIHVLEYLITKLVQIRKSLILYWFITFWTILFIIFITHKVFILTPDYLSFEVSDLKRQMDYLWISTLFVSVHHILLIISILILIVKKGVIAKNEK